MGYFKDTLIYNNGDLDMTYSHKYQRKQMSDSEIYQQQVAIEETKDCDCHFCRSAGIEPPAEGSYGRGGYREFIGDEPILFSGYICDMHHDEIDWINFAWM